MTKQLPLGINLLNNNYLVKRTEDLRKQRRGKKVLFVEKETASWIILEGPELAFFNSIRKPATVRDLKMKQPTRLSNHEKEQLLIKLYERNMITINGISHYEPGTMWQHPQKYPGFLCFHITHACNFRCKYCYAMADMESGNKKFKKMPREVYYRAAEKIIEEIPLDALLIDFHGGEPMVAYDQILDLIQHARKYQNDRGIKKKVSFIAQTNGSLLTLERYRKLKSMDCSVGVSLDGPRDIHNVNRVYPDGSGTHDNILKNVKEIEENGGHVGFLAVVHDPRNYVDVLKYFIDKGKRNIRINYSAYIGRATEELEFPHGRAEYFARQYLELVDYAIEWVNEHKKEMVIKDLDSQLNNIYIKDRNFMCYRSPCGCGRAILGFGADGGIFACEEAVGVEAFRIGSIFDDTSMTDIIDNSEILKNIRGRTVDNIPKCRDCTWKHFCGGRCTTKSFAKFGNFRREDPMCRFYQVVYPELIWKFNDQRESIKYLNPQLSGMLPPIELGITKKPSANRQRKCC